MLISWWFSIAVIAAFQTDVTLMLCWCHADVIMSLNSTLNSGCGKRGRGSWCDFVVGMQGLLPLHLPHKVAPPFQPHASSLMPGGTSYWCPLPSVATSLLWPGKQSSFKKEFWFWTLSEILRSNDSPDQSKGIEQDRRVLISVWPVVRVIICLFYRAWRVPVHLSNPDCLSGLGFMGPGSPPLLWQHSWHCAFDQHHQVRPSHGVWGAIVRMGPSIATW